jgi:hypothetical protein
MDKEPKLPTPMIDPRQVAQAILDAAQHPARSVKVGAVATLNTAIAKLVPAAGEKLAALQASRQHYDASPRDPDGTLFKPGGGGRMHGQAPQAG